MSKNINYSAIFDFANANKLNFCVVNDDEIDSAMQFNGLSFIDTETFEIPCSFMVEKAVIVNIPTPNEMTPEDTGESYGKYKDFVDGLTAISRPQYIAPDGCYIKLMCWCKWADTGVIGDDEVEDTKTDTPNPAFFKACKDAVEKVKSEHWYDGNLLDFRVWIEGADNPNPEDDPTPEIFSINEIEKMYDYIKDKSNFDCEIYVTESNHLYAFTSDHGVWLTKNGIEAY